MTMVDNRTNYARDISLMVYDTYSASIKVFGTEIPMAVFLFRQVFKKSLSCEYNRSGRKVTYYIGCSFFMNSIDKKTWYVYNKNMQRKLGVEVFL